MNTEKLHHSMRKKSEEPDEPDEEEAKRQAPGAELPTHACTVRLETLGITIEAVGGSLIEAHAACVDLLGRALDAVKKEKKGAGRASENGYR